MSCWPCDSVAPCSCLTSRRDHAASPCVSPARGRFGNILSALKSPDPGQQHEALTELVELLCIGTEESLVSFSVDSFTPALVELLQMDYSPDTMRE